MVGNGLAELHTFLGISDGIFQTGTADTAGLRADADASGVESRHHLLKSLSRLAQQISRRNFRILENQFGRAGGQNAQFLFDLAHFEAGGFLQIDNQIDDTLVAQR